jgi:hypothetical protein
VKRYLLSVALTERAPAPIERVYKNVDAFNAELRAAGAWVFAGGLHPPSTATVLALKDGEILMTDGPFAEGKEYVGGIWVIEANDLDAALAWASKATRACEAAVEVRPFQDDMAD